MTARTPNSDNQAGGHTQPNVVATAPERIFLVIGDDYPPEETFVDEEVTWCQDGVNDNDIVYIRKDVAQRQTAELQAEFDAYKEGSEEAFGAVVDEKKRLEKEKRQFRETIEAQQRVIVKFRTRNAELLAAHRRIRAVVDEQAEDEGLWFVAQTAPEAYLQQELRKLHAAIEAIASAEGGKDIDPTDSEMFRFLIQRLPAGTFCDHEVSGAESWIEAIKAGMSAEGSNA